MVTEWLVPAVTATAVGTLILLLVYAYLYKIFKQKYFFIWTLSWIAYFVRFLFSGAIAITNNMDFMIAIDIFVVISAVLLLWGVFLFYEKRFHLAWIGLSAVIIVWSFFAELSNMGFAISKIPSFFFVGGVYIFTGIVFLRMEKIKRFGAYFTGISFILWGFHKIDYPFLRSIDAFAPWGYLLGTVFEFFVAIGILLIYFEKNYKAMIESKTHFSLFMKYFPGGVFISDASGRLVFLSKWYEEIQGISAESLLGKDLKKIFPPNIVKQYEEENKKIISENKTYSHEERIPMPSGERVFHTVKFPLDSEDGVLIGGIHIDISDIKKAQKENKENLARLITVLNGLKAVVYVVDIETYEVLFLNDYAKKDAGNVEGEICWQSFQKGQTGPCSFCTNNILKERGENSTPYTWEFQNTRNGKWFYIQDSLIRWTNGKLVRLEIATDITQRKTAETERDMFFTNARDLLCVASMDGHLMQVNRAWTETLGFSEAELTSRKWLDFVHPDDVDATISAEATLKNGKSVYRFENRYIDKDGKYHWLSWNSYPNEEKRILYGVARDITEAKKISEEKEYNSQKLAETNDRLKDILESISDGFMVLEGEKFRVVHYNRAAANILGKEPSEVINTNLFDSFPEAKGSVFEEQYSWAFKHKESLSFETYFQVPPYINWYEVRVFPYQDGITVYFRITTERKKYEQALKESEERYRTLVEMAPLPILVHRENTILYLNLAAANVLQGTRDDFLGESLKHFVEKESIILEEKENISHSKYTEARQESLITRTGENITVEIIRAEIDYMGGEAVQILFNDITERKKTEETIRQYMKGLQRTNEELEQFAYIASHDLQEPLRTITNYLSLFEKRYGENLDEKAEGYINSVSRAAVRMRDIIGSLLTYSRTARTKENFATFNLEESLEEAIESLTEIVKESGVDIIVKERLGKVFGNKTLLANLLQNLLANAIKFRSEKPLKIEISSIDDGDKIRFCVKDNGVGFKPDHAVKIFTIFKRLHGRDKYEGTGIGLAICKKIVDMHGGAIWAESDEGEGASFFFTIPKGN